MASVTPRRCSFDFHGECERCVLPVGHAGTHQCVHETDLTPAESLAAWESWALKQVGWDGLRRIVDETMWGRTRG